MRYPVSVWRVEEILHEANSELSPRVVGTALIRIQQCLQDLVKEVGQQQDEQAREELAGVLYRQRSVAGRALLEKI